MFMGKAIKRVEPGVMPPEGSLISKTDSGCLQLVELSWE
jgi:hypothetical protein